MIENNEMDEVGEVLESVGKKGRSQRERIQVDQTYWFDGQCREEGKLARQALQSYRNKNDESRKVIRREVDGTG